ncbi:hypothetical protein ACOMHN_006463 [Nucella lapillus]
MAKAELVCEGSFEIEFTSPPLTSDQSKSLSTSSPKHTHAQPTSEVTEPAPQSRDTWLQTNKGTTETQKDSIVLDENATPQVCQQVEIITEEASCNEPCFPRIDAVWSISQEHSYEQKLPRGGEQKSFHMSQNVAEPDPVHDAPYGKGTRSVEIQHTPTLPYSQNKGTEVLKTCSGHTPQVLKIQGKPSKKYFIHDSPDMNRKPSKYRTLHGGKSQPMTKSYKTLKVLQLPSHSSNYSSWNSCLIDHNLKPLQIQHNLEHKNKALAVLKLETLSLKYRDDAEDSSFHARDSDGPRSPTPPFSGRGRKGKFIMKDASTDNADNSHMDEEVGTDAVYLDVDPDPSSNPDFTESMQQEEDMETGEGGEEEVDQSSVHSLSMDHYLPDFTDLPPFPNIPMDQPEDQYTEPTQLTPSIQHNLFDYEWPKTYWNHQTSPCTFPMQMVAFPNPASTSTVPNPSPMAMVPSTAVPSSLPVHNPMIPTPNSAVLDQTSTGHSGQITMSGGVENAGAASSVPDTSNCSDTPLLSIASSLEAATPSGAMTHLVTATDITMATCAFPATAAIKTETQDSWSGPAESSQPPTVMSTLPPPPSLTTASGDSTMAAPSSSLDSHAPLRPESAISTALLTAFDLDSQPSAMMGSGQAGGGSSSTTSSYPYPDQSYADPPYPDPSYADAPAYCENGGGVVGAGCASTFLSPPPSVEPQASQRSTPRPDNESGYLTMEEQELQSPYWPHQHHHHYHHHYPGSSTDDADNGYVNATYPATISSGFGEGGGYPYTHQDSHYQTLNQTASTATNGGNNNNNNDIIYYPFNDLMQLNPSLLGSETDMSIQYVHPGSYPAPPYPQQTLPDPCPDPSGQGYLGQGSSTAARQRRGRGGRPRGTRQCPSGQIQSDQISSSLQRQLQAQMGAPPKRQYRRRNPDARRKLAVAKAPRCGMLDGGRGGGDTMSR